VKETRKKRKSNYENKTLTFQRQINRKEQHILKRIKKKMIKISQKYGTPFRKTYAIRTSGANIASSEYYFLLTVT
jgi:Skp family chaperone for outer membrane proteins